ncbi:MAG TPA: pyruvate kinase [Ilumatobacteraceae bacterium]|nr:pyruvate kinase [Ilumatobacteraceae bacterium]
MQAVANVRPELEALEGDVRAVRDAMLDAEASRADDIAATHPAHRRSAANLVHYLELRQHDVRDLQARLAAAGLSSLGRSEAHVLATIEEVLSVLARLNGHEPPPRAAGVAFTEGHKFLAANAKALLGTPPGTRGTRIMVTLPTEAAEEPDLVARMIANGMDLARVNCAHDHPEIWQQMVDHVRSTRRPNGHRPRVAMDLAGPKLRTGPLHLGPRVVRISPRRDRLGHVTTPALVWLTAHGASAAAPRRVGVVPVDDADWLKRRQPGDRLEFVDSRNATRHWVVVEAREDGCLVTATQTAYVSTGMKLVCATGADEDAAAVGELPEVELVHRVDTGDHLTLTRTLEPAEPTAAGSEHRIGCTLPEAFEQAKAGERVWLDDGKIGGVIVRVTSEEIEVRVTDVRPGGVKLKAGKGINFPETDLRLDALTLKDLDDLDFVAGHADLVNLSFVRHPADVEQLQAELERRDAGDVGIVLKIENVAAFEHLPELLLAAMRSRKVGVMIARGDLAVEVGFERLAEVQEEILWACEAAHVPVIWATQVLDTLARTGQPSRAEITDAAMSERAECVMLNKGPHITDAIHTLDSILTRMQHHQHKKRSLLRRLQAWDRTPSP